MNGRIVGGHHQIDEERVEDFFHKRAERSLPHRYNYVIYRDMEPELALRRDRYEKEIITPLLNLHADSVALDIGCGVGRWADEIGPLLSGRGQYVGVDFSGELLDIAKENVKMDCCCFYRGNFQEIRQILENNSCPLHYNVILINGVLMYLNDDDLNPCLKEAWNLLAGGGVLYVKESVGVSQRFTLKDFYSDELRSDYNAIYRSVQEYNETFGAVFGGNHKIIRSEDMWKGDLERKAETTSYYWIVEKQL